MPEQTRDNLGIEMYPGKEPLNLLYDVSHWAFIPLPSHTDSFQNQNAQKSITAAALGG